MGRLSYIALAIGLTVPQSATTHPHLFVEAGLTVLFENGAPVGVQVDWVYDEFFSLLLTSDLGIDLDGDGALSAAEEAALDEAVTQWPPGFDGDLEVRQNGAIIPLGAKVAHTMDYADGIVRESHVRVLSGMDASAFTLQAFDPFYYVAYDLMLPIRVVGRDDCTAAITRADLEAARARATELLGGIAPEDVPPEGDFPEIGSSFADTVTITCG